MPDFKLTPEEKEQLFNEAKQFADACRKKQDQLPKEFQLIHYATDEEIQQNLENPEFVANYLKAKRIKTDFEQRREVSKEQSKRHNETGLAVSAMDRSKATMFQIPDSEENRKYNEKLEEVLYDPDKGQLNYEKYLKDALDDDYSDLEGALESTSQGLDFYQKHAPKITGFFSGEHLTDSKGLNDTAENHFKNLRSFFTDTWAFYQQMEFTASFANFAVTEIPQRDFAEYGTYMSIMFPRTEDPYRQYMEGIHAINKLHLMKDQVNRYKTLGGDLGPGFLRDFEVVDKTGKSVDITSKPIEELRLQKLSNEKSQELSKMFSPEKYELQVKRAVRVARSSQKADPLDEKFLPPYHRDEALIQQKKDALATSVREYKNMSFFQYLFAFGKRSEIRALTKELKEVGATDLEVKLVKNNGVLSKREYNRELDKLRAASDSPDVKNPSPSRSQAADFAADMRFIKTANVKGITPETIADEVGQIETNMIGQPNDTQMNVPSVKTQNDRESIIVDLHEEQSINNYQEMDNSKNLVTSLNKNDIQYIAE